MKLCWLLITGLCLVSASLRAVPPEETQAGMNQQAAVDFKAADVKLNAVYKQLLALLEGVEKEKLIAAQKKWIAFRDAEADYQAATAEGGSMRPTLYYGTATELTEQRTKSLGRDVEFHKAEK